LTSLPLFQSFEHRLCSRRCYGLGMEFGDVRDFRCESLVTECMTRLAIKDKHKDMIIARN
jgi:hypothetical protein